MRNETLQLVNLYLLLLELKIVYQEENFELERLKLFRLMRTYHHREFLVIRLFLFLIYLNLRMRRYKVSIEASIAVKLCIVAHSGQVFSQGQIVAHWHRTVFIQVLSMAQSAHRLLWHRAEIIVGVLNVGRSI